MRVAFGLAGLALAVIATGACDEPYKEADAMTCMAYLALHSSAVSQGQAEGDAAAVQAAATAYWALSEQKFGAQATAEYFASFATAYEDVNASEVALIARRCADDVGAHDA